MNIFTTLWNKIKSLFRRKPKVKDHIAVFKKRFPPQKPKPVKPKKPVNIFRRLWTADLKIQSVADDSLVDVACDVACDVTELPQALKR